MNSGNENAELRANRADGFTQGQTTFQYGQNPNTFLSKNPSGLDNQTRHEIASCNPQVGALRGDTFWSASRLIVQQLHQVLKPGAYSIWVCKRFVRDKAIVDFPHQWEQLCHSCGFETVEWIRAWLVEDRGNQYTLEGKLETRTVKRLSFFRRLHVQKYPELAIEWEDVIVLRRIP